MKNMTVLAAGLLGLCALSLSACATAENADGEAVAEKKNCRYVEVMGSNLRERVCESAED